MSNKKDYATKVNGNMASIHTNAEKRAVELSKENNAYNSTLTLIEIEHTNDGDYTLFYVNQDNKVVTINVNVYKVN